MEDLAEAVALERTRRAQIVPPDQYPAIMLPQQEGQALPMTFDGGVDPHAPIVVPPVVTPVFPPQALEGEGHAGALARREGCTGGRRPQ